MTRLLLLFPLACLLAPAADATAAPAGPCVYWAGTDDGAALKGAGINRVCVPPDRAEALRGAGFEVTAIAPADLSSRIALPTPGMTRQVWLASATRSPWVDANGWRFTRNRAGRFSYELPAGKAALAAAESFAYGADAVLKIDPADVPALGQMLAFQAQLPARDLPPVADFGVVDDGSPLTGEVLNLLTRRNLLYQIVPAPSRQFPVTIVIGSKEYSKEEAADPSAFALKIRRQLTDEKRTLRVFGSEIVVCRVTGDAARVRLHLLNYGGRELEGLRIRLRGTYKDDGAYVAGAGRVELKDYAVTDGATEFSMPRMGTYAVVDLTAAVP